MSLGICGKQTNPIYTPSYSPLSSIHLSLSSLISVFATVLLLTGRAESGFRHVEPEKYPPRLLHFKGKRVSSCTLACEGDV